MGTNSMTVMNAGPLLDDLLAIINKEVTSDYIYLNRSATSPGKNALGFMEDTLPEILQLLGIRSIMVHNSYDLSRLRALHIDMPENELQEYFWPYLRKEEVLNELQQVFRHCQTVGFDNWAALASASSVWDGLLSDVIKPLERDNLEFIFYLGDPSVKLSFQVGEALDIVSDFSLHGRVTFALDENEALHLWKILNGVSKETPLGEQTYVDLRKKYFSISRTMDIARVLVYSTSNVMVFTQQEQFGLVRKMETQEMEVAPEARLNFINGYSCALAMNLDLPRCITLGLIAFGCRGEKEMTQKKDVVKYIEDWMADLQRTTEISLYGE